MLTPLSPRTVRWHGNLHSWPNGQVERSRASCPVLKIEVSSTSSKTGVAISPLRQRMIEDMNARELCSGTQRGHIHSCKRFAAFLKRSPDTATAEDIRRFQLHLSETGARQPHLLSLRAREAPDRAATRWRRLGGAAAADRRRRFLFRELRFGAKMELGATGALERSAAPGERSEVRGRGRRCGWWPTSPIPFYELRIGATMALGRSAATMMMMMMMSAAPGRAPPQRPTGSSITDRGRDPCRSRPRRVTHTCCRYPRARPTRHHQTEPLEPAGRRCGG